MNVRLIVRPLDKIQASVVALGETQDFLLKLFRSKRRSLGGVHIINERLVQPPECEWG
jgi:hypothetical protein